MLEFLVWARIQELWRAANNGLRYRPEPPPTGDTIHPIDRGRSRGVLLADIKPIVDEEKTAS